MSSSNVILIITHKHDSHTDRVIDILHSSKIPVIRVNSNDYPVNNISFARTGKDYHWTIYHDKDQIQVSEIRSVWFRKPFHHRDNENKSGTEGRLAFNFKKEEFKRFCISFFTALDDLENVFQCSSLAKIMQAEDKIFQLKEAAGLGFQVPDTLVSSNFSEIKAFLSQHHNKAIIKVLGKSYVESGDLIKAFYTYKITTSDFIKFYQNKPIDFPIYFQEFVQKKEEYRITVIGNQVFAVAIDSQALDDSKVDWRAVVPTTLVHRAIKLPEYIERQCIALCRKLGLQFGAIDMAVTPKGKYIFFEINSNGQYLWLEDMTKLPLSKAMADLLAYPEKHKIR